MGDKRLMACFQTVVRSVLLAGRRHEGASRLRLRRVTTADASRFFTFRVDLLDLLSAFAAGEPDRRVVLSVEAVRKNMYRTSAVRDQKFISPVVRRSKIGLRRHRPHLKYKIGRLKQEIERMKAIEAQLAQQEDTQISLTDPDARSMQGTGKATGTVGYNVQCAVEIKNHLIVAHEVTNAVNDRSQLLSMAKQAKAALGAETMEAFADRGYYKAEEVLACEGTGILPYVPKTQTSNNPNRGLFSGQHFIYDAKTDSYTCPAGASLTKGAVRSDRRDNIDQYRNLTACLTCSLKPRCTPDRVKRVKRWQHEGVLDNMQARLDRMPDAMTIRRQTVEHTFGTLKAWMGATHFLTKTLKNVRTEMSLQVLAYNMKRMINMFGVKPLLRAIAA